MMHSYAQTILQLYGQLQRQAYSVVEISLVRDAYELASSLFTGRFQYSGKPFIAHVVGTASILGSLRLPAPLVAAGLLHNVYSQGDFGDGGSGISPGKREKVRRVVGQEVEAYLAGFAAQRWNSQTISIIRDHLQALGPVDRGVLLIRLADQLEHDLELGSLHGGDAEARQQFIKDAGPAMVEIAAKLGHPALAAELSRAFAETASAEIPDRFRTSHSHSFVIAPGSYRRRLAVVFRQQLVSALRRLRSATGVRTKLRALRGKLRVRSLRVERIPPK